MPVLEVVGGWLGRIVDLLSTVTTRLGSKMQTCPRVIRQVLEGFVSGISDGHTSSHPRSVMRVSHSGIEGVIPCSQEPVGLVRRSRQRECFGWVGLLRSTADVEEVVQTGLDAAFGGQQP